MSQKISFNDIKERATELIHETVTPQIEDELYLQAKALLKLTKEWQGYVLAENETERDFAFHKIYMRFSCKIRGDDTEKQKQLRRTMRNIIEKMKPEISDTEEPPLLEVTPTKPYRRFEGRRFSPKDEDYPSFLDH